MNRQEISWIIVRAFGVYLLVQAFILLPELLAALLTVRYYSNAMSSLSPESNTGASFTRVTTSMYRTLAFAPLVKIILYSAVGIYMVRGGRFVFRLLDRTPNKPTDLGTDGG